MAFEILSYKYILFMLIIILIDIVNIYLKDNLVTYQLLVITENLKKKV